MILLPLCSLGDQRITTHSSVTAIVLYLLLHQDCFSTLNLKRMGSWSLLFYGFCFFFSITVQLLFIYIPKSYIFWWCVLSFLLHLIYSLVNICQLYLPSGERDLWMQSEGHRAKPALTTVLPTEGSFLYWQSPIITFQLSATGIKSQIILRWQGRLKGGINLCTSQAKTTLTILPIPPVGLDSCFSQYVVKGTVSVKSLYFFSIFLFWFLALSIWLHVFN